MTYLELVNDFLIETGMEDPIATVTGQIDDGGQAVQWVRDAWTEIQRGEKWAFRWAEGSFDTVPGQKLYSPANAGDTFDRTAFFNQSTKIPMLIGDYSELKYRDDEGEPTMVSIRPDRKLSLYYVPNDVYTIDYAYWAAPTALLDDGDIPSIDPSYHKAIVWKAITNYAREQGKEWNGLYVAANREYNSIYSDMLIEHLPPFLGKVPL